MTRTDPNPRKDRVCQGDVLREVEYFESVFEKGGVLEVTKVVFPLAIVLTQDCDLEQDHKFRAHEQETRDKWLISVLLAPMYNAQHFQVGEHLSDIDIKSQAFGSKERKRIWQNNNPRYHYFEFESSIGLVPCVVDFKHYFSAPVPYLEKVKSENFVCKVSELYREDISQRFASFLSRIGLPDQGEQQQE